MQGKSTLVYIGTHTSDKAKGIYLFRLQSAGTEVFQNVTLVPLGLAAETPNPTFFEIDAKRRLLFAVNEIDQYEGKPGGAVQRVRHRRYGRLKMINKRGRREYGVSLFSPLEARICRGELRRRLGCVLRSRQTASSARRPG